MEKFPEYENYATQMLKEEIELVDPALVCLASTPAIENNTISDWSLLSDKNKYSNPPVEDPSEMENAGDIIGGIYVSDSFPAPVAMFPHPSKLYNNYPWSIDGDGAKQRFAEAVRELEF